MLFGTSRVFGDIALKIGIDITGEIPGELVYFEDHGWRKPGPYRQMG